MSAHRNRSALRFATTGLVCFAILGWSSIAAAQQKNEASEYPCSASESGVDLGVDVMTNAAQVKKYFQNDLIGKAALPVFIHVWNGTKDGLVVTPLKVEIAAVSGEGEQAVRTTTRRLAEDEVVQIQDTTTSSEYDLQLMQLRPSTVPVGEQAQGFVLFEIPEKGDFLKAKHEVTVNVSSEIGTNVSLTVVCAPQ